MPLTELNNFPSCTTTFLHKNATCCYSIVVCCDWTLEQLMNFTFKSVTCFCKSSFISTKSRFCSFTSLWNPNLTEGLKHEFIHYQHEYRNHFAKHIYDPFLICSPFKTFAWVLPERELQFTITQTAVC